jgi:hypothetical protein
MCEIVDKFMMAFHKLFVRMYCFVAGPTLAAAVSTPTCGTAYRRRGEGGKRLDLL